MTYEPFPFLSCHSATIEYTTQGIVYVDVTTASDAVPYRSSSHSSKREQNGGE